MNDKKTCQELLYVKYNNKKSLLRFFFVIETRVWQIE